MIDLPEPMIANMLELARLDRVAVLLPLVLVASCGGPNLSDYVATCKDGVTKLPAARQMAAQYTEVDHFITHFGLGQQPLTWNTEAFIDGRFRLTLQVPVTIDYSARTVSQSGEPRFFLHAVEKIRILPGDRAEASYDGSLQRHFAEDEWNDFVASGFDLTSLGIPKSEIRPVAQFDDYVRGWRRDRVPIK